MAGKEEKTNVMRLLEQKKIPYTLHVFPDGDIGADGLTIALALGVDPERSFKTLVTRGASGGYYVFDLPVNRTLDLKKAARAVGEKSVAMVLSRELLPLTGYVHGGCSPLGMKKPFPTVFHQTAVCHPNICVSAGKIGRQIEVAPEVLLTLTGAKTADLVTEEKESSSSSLSEP